MKIHWSYGNIWMGYSFICYIWHARIIELTLSVFNLEKSLSHLPFCKFIVLPVLHGTIHTKHHFLLPEWIRFAYWLFPSYLKTKWFQTYNTFLSLFYFPYFCYNVYFSVCFCVYIFEYSAYLFSQNNRHWRSPDHICPFSVSFNFLIVVFCFF